jgi:hypothetical protein
MTTQTQYYCKPNKTGDGVEEVKRFGSLPRSADSLDMDMVGVNLNIKNADAFIARFGWYPCTLTGEGSIPDRSAIAWHPESMTGSGSLAPYPVSRSESLLSFSDRFEDDEFDAISESAIPDVKRAWKKFNLASNIDRDDPRTIGFMALLVGHGVITQARSDEVLG